jgi:hypothetical protein
MTPACLTPKTCCQTSKSGEEATPKRLTRALGRLADCEFRIRQLEILRPSCWRPQDLSGLARFIRES